MWWRSSSILISFVVIGIAGGLCLAACPSADVTGDCFVDFNDFAVMAAEWPASDFDDVGVMANQWLTSDACVPDDMVFIPGGTFDMGDNLNEGDSWELPVHTVTVDSFYMGQYMVTSEEYCHYLNSGILAGDVKFDGGIVYAFSDSSNSFPYCDTHSYYDDSQIDYSGGIFSVRTKSGRDMSIDPMVEVSWYGAVGYCNWRSQEEGKQECYSLSAWNCDFSKKGYRLATEGEWEYAARGGLSGRRFPWGDTISHSQANYFSSSSYSYDISPTRGFHPTWLDGVFPFTSAVDSFAASGYGLYDMAGNVFEWCYDWYDLDYYDYSPTENPTGALSGGFRVVRGGVWEGYASNCRVAYRSGRRPERRYGGGGFRVVLPD